MIARFHDLEGNELEVEAGDTIITDIVIDLLTKEPVKYLYLLKDYKRREISKETYDALNEFNKANEIPF